VPRIVEAKSYRWVILFAAWIAPWLATFAASSAWAVPHIISAPDHPYDPDWPEVYWAIQRKCLGCHVADTERTDLSSYVAMISANVDGDAIIVPGRADKSMLYEYVEWNVHADPDSDLPDEPMMPEDQSEWLTAGQLAALRRWIDRGALEYVLPEHCNIRPLTELDFPSARQCATCHPKQYDEWSRSMHAYAQKSPVYMAFNFTLHERTSGTIGTFCTRCHTPIGTSLGENGLRRNVHRSRLSLESVTCVACHRQDRPQYKNSGRVAPLPGNMFDQCVFGPFEDSVSQPLGAHASVGAPYIRTSQFCGNCHDVTNPAGLRLEEAFSEWQNSPAAQAGIRCQDCHMGPVQGLPVPASQRPLGRAAVVPGVAAERIPLRPLSDHTFAGPDYSLLPDTEFPHKLDWMYETDYRDPANLTPHQQKTLEQLRRRNRASLQIADEKRLELLTNAAHIEVRHPAVACAGDKVQVAVDVVNHVAGHGFPTGFSAERQLWVEIEVRDPAGNVVFASGDLDHNRDLRDDHSHEVLTGTIPPDRHLLNFQNKFTVIASEGTERTVVISVNRDVTPLNILRPATGVSQLLGHPPVFRIAKGNLPPLQTVGRKYPVHLAPYVGLYHVRVRLNFRNLPPTLLDHVGTPHLKHLLQVVVIDEYDGVIRVVD